MSVQVWPQWFGRKTTLAAIARWRGKNNCVKWSDLCSSQHGWMCLQFPSFALFGSFGISDKKCIRKQDGLVCQIRPTYQGYLTLWLGWFPDLFTQVSSGKWSSNLSMQFCVCWRICSFAGDGTIYYLDRLFRAQLGSRVHFLTCLRPDSHDVQVFQIQTALVFFWGMLKSYHFDLAYLAVAKYDKAAWTIGGWRTNQDGQAGR